MKIWLPYVRAGSGADVYTRLLSRGLGSAGHETVTQPLPHKLQYFPWALRALSPPRGTDVVLANSWNAFAFRRPGSKLVTVEHHCIFDPAYVCFRSPFQALFHEGMVRGFERASFRAADAVVAVSQYTAEQVGELFPGVRPTVILNGIDTDWFSPSRDASAREKSSPFRLLFVGNLTSRKGADLLPHIMSALGSGYHLRYTAGLRTRAQFSGVPNMEPTGRLTDDEMREAYRTADALLFPTRLEGFGYAAAEAMACGIPVIATRASSLPELVSHEETGILCAPYDVRGFVDAVRALAADPEHRQAMGRKARAHAVARFSLGRMVTGYARLFHDVAETDLMT